MALLLIAPAPLAAQAVQEDPWRTLQHCIDNPVKTMPWEEPSTPNPFLNTLPPDAECDYAGWMRYLQHRADQRAAVAGNLAPGLSLGLAEEESNDSPSDAQVIEGLGSDPGQVGRIFIEGSGAPIPEIAFADLVPMEDDGAIPLANATGIPGPGNGVMVQGLIGDKPGGMESGLADFDFFRVEATAGLTLSIDVNTPEPFGDLDPFISLWSADGVLLALNDDGSPSGSITSFDSFLEVSIPADGSYYVVIGGFGAFIPADPFDPESGSVTGDTGSEGSYELLISLFVEPPIDFDFYQVHLERGDVLGMAKLGVSRPGQIAVFNPLGQLITGTFNNNGAFLHPVTNPLPFIGQLGLSFVAPESGTYFMAAAGGFGPYTLEALVTRPGFELSGTREQIIFLDFNAGNTDVSSFLGAPFPVVRYLSPFRAFLRDWGLPDDPISTLKMVRRVTHVVQESLNRDLHLADLNPNFKVRILHNAGLGNSEWYERLLERSGLPVSKVVVGGTIQESGISTIGIAESIDPGNFEAKELGLVLLDVLSAPASGGNADETFSLNDVVLAPGVSKEELVATAVGNIVAHEAGHYLGNWHTDGFNDFQNIMDEGPGGLFNLAGIGPSGVFGAPDRKDVDFETDAYSQREGFFGVENTQVRTAFALSFAPAGEHLLAIGPELANGASLAAADPLLRLSQNYPNPARVAEPTQIGFTVETDGRATLTLYTLDGKQVADLFDQPVFAGEVYQVPLLGQAHNLPPGTYLYTLRTQRGEMSRKLVLAP